MSREIWGIMIYKKQQEINLLLSQIHTISIQGKNNTNNQADFKRYKMLGDLVKKLIESTSYFTSPTVSTSTPLINDFVTPKVRLRIVIFKGDKLLLVHKKNSDRGWALPGGWAALGLSIGENTTAKAYHETGIDAQPIRLLGVKDVSKHDYKPVNLEQAYKIFMEAEIKHEPKDYTEQHREVKFVTLEDARELSLSPTETLFEDIEMAFDSKNDADFEPFFD